MNPPIFRGPVVERAQHGVVEAAHVDSDSEISFDWGRLSDEELRAVAMFVRGAGFHDQYLSPVIPFRNASTIALMMFSRASPVNARSIVSIIRPFSFC